MRELGVTWLEMLLEAEYGLRDYDLLKDNDWDLDEEVVQFAVKDVPLEEYQRDYIKEIRITGSTKFILGYCLNDLCCKGKIQPGTYILVSDLVEYPDSTPIVHWNSRVIVRETREGPEYSSYEVHYNNNGTPAACTAEPVDVHTETYQQFLHWTLNMLSKPPMVFEGLKEIEDPKYEGLREELLTLIKKYGLDNEDNSVQ